MNLICMVSIYMILGKLSFLFHTLGMKPKMPIVKAIDGQHVAMDTDFALGFLLVRDAGTGYAGNGDERLLDSMAWSRV